MTPRAWLHTLQLAYRRQSTQGRARWWAAGGGVVLMVGYALLSGGGDPEQPNMGMLALSVTLKLVFILALIYGSLALLRYWQGNRPTARQRQIAVVETVRLSPRQAIHLVRAGEQMLLIGATDQGLALLADLELAPATAAATAPVPAAPEFAALLAAHAPATANAPA